MRISVLVPSYRRPYDLDRCLAALSAQTRPAQEVIVVARSGDLNTFGMADKWSRDLPIKGVLTSVPGQVRALNAGLDAVTGDVVAITDDDAAPHADWLLRIEAHFATKPDLGGLGGRDCIQDGDIEAFQKTVGRVQRWGRIVGNHHLGSGLARDVEILKGVNMSFCMAALEGIRFETQLKGEGAQVHNDMAFCLDVKRKGWRIVYDPAVVVDHYVGKRHDGDQRARFDPVGTTNRAFNKYWALCHGMQPGTRRTIALLWNSCVGTKDEPGLACFTRSLLRGNPDAFKTWRCTLAGRSAARQELKLVVRSKVDAPIMMQPKGKLRNG